jgi:hypothetical protein
VTVIVVGPTFRHPGQHRQHRLGPVQRLDLGLLVHAQHHCPLGWVVVEPDDVDDLVDKQRVGRQLEGVGQVRVEAEVPPDPTDRGLAQPGALGHPGPRPVGRLPGGLLQGRDHHLLDLVQRDRRRPARPVLVDQAIQPPPDEPAPPLAHRVGMHPQVGGDLLVGSAWVCRPRRPARSCSAGPAPATTSHAVTSPPGSCARQRSVAARPLAFLSSAYRQA